MICPSNNDHYDELDYGLVAYIDSLIRQVHADGSFQERLNKCTSIEDAQVLIDELDKMRMPLPYERTPHTVNEINEATKFLADKDDFYERNITPRLCGGDSITEG